MVVVRLARGGAKKHPFYHIVVTDSRRRRDSGYIERLGYFNPFATAKEIPVFLNRDRFDYWVSKGAKSSPRVSSIISKLDKGKFVGGDETKVEVKKTDTTETADAEKTTAAEDTKQSAEATADTPQAELKLNDTAEDKQEEKQAVSSAAAKSEDGNEATDDKAPTEESAADKKADG